MGLFNLSWFKTKKKEEELLDLQIKKEKIIIGSLEKELDKEDEKEMGGKLLPSDKGLVFLPFKPYKKVKFVNDVLTVIFNDGSVINKPQSTVDDFNDVRMASSEQEIINIMKTDIKSDILDEIKAPSADDYFLVSRFPDFEVKEECIYMNGIDRSLPPLLLQRFGEILSKFDRTKQGWENEALNDLEYSSLKKFWLKCCLNPNAQSAEDLYTFLTYHNMKIDRHGNFFAYRRVVKVKDYLKTQYGATNKIVDVISGAYNNVKAVWKKRPSDFRIEEINGEYSMHKVTSTPKGTIVGNLDTLYLDLPNMQENRYTDAHTHTMDYRVGQIASIPRDQCDDDNSVSCSKGLHICRKEYDYSGFGDTPILAIVNPMDIVATPLHDLAKMRTARWFFAMTLVEEDKYILDDDDFDVTELGDIFEEKCLANIEQHVHTSFAEEVKRHTFSIPQMSNVDIKHISSMLKNMNDIIKKRVVNQ